MRRFNKFLLVCLTLLGLTFLFSPAWFGREYYQIPDAKRATHELHDRLKPDGLMGHGYGFAGVLLIGVNLLYLARRHFSFMRNVGSLKSWMEVHVFAGLVGPGLILFHSAFLFSNPTAVIALISLGALVLTGLIGRYIYAQVPHTLTGAEASVGDLRFTAQDAVDDLVEQAGDSYTALLEKLDELIPVVDPVRRGRFRTLIGLPALSWRNWRVQRQVHHIYQEFLAETQLTHAQARHVHQALHRIARLRIRLRFLRAFRELLAWWRGLHRYFALLMLMTAIIHIVIAIYMGAKWVF